MVCERTLFSTIRHFVVVLLFFAELKKALTWSEPMCVIYGKSISFTHYKRFAYFKDSVTLLKHAFYKQNSR